MAPAMSSAVRPPELGTAGHAPPAPRDPRASVVIPAAAAAVTLALHLRFIALDHSLPVADASGHLLNTTRWLGWLAGGSAPREAFPPGVYLLAGELMRWQGLNWDLALTAVALHGAMLVAGLSWFATRAAGPMAGVTAAALALAAPFLTGASRMYLLDIPATAAIVWIWALCWESRGYSRWLPTLALGPVLAWGALVKYTLLLWIVPVLLLHGLRLVTRRPTALLPLCIASAACGLALDNLVRHGTHGVASRVPLPSILAIEQPLLGVGGFLLFAIAVTSVLGERTRGVREGAVLGLSAILAVALITPWFFDSGAAVWVKLKHEAIDEVRAAGVEGGQTFAIAFAGSNWPAGRTLLAVGIVLEGAGLAIALAARGRWQRWVGISPVQWFPGPVVEVAVCCIVGVIVTAQMLPVDPRYYLPAVAGVAIVIAIGTCRLPVFAYTAGAAVLALSVAQIVRGAGLPVGGLAVQRIDPVTFDPGAFARGSPVRFFLPPTPSGGTVTDAMDALLTAVARQPSTVCEGIVLHIPAFGVGRAAGFEPQSIASMGSLRGIKHCAWHWTEAPPTDADRVTASLVAIFGLPPAAADDIAAQWGDVIAPKPLLSADANGFAVRLYGRP